MHRLPLAIQILAQNAADLSPDPWAETVFGLNPEHRFVLLIVTIGCGVGVILGALAIVTGTLNSIHRRRAEMDLKREMIDRGMSADEIAKIIESAAPPEDATQRWIASWACRKKPS